MGFMGTPSAQREARANVHERSCDGLLEQVTAARTVINCCGLITNTAGDVW
jgi:hypothetical protein